MANFANKRDVRSKLIKTQQDRPIPIEPSGVNEQRLKQNIFRLKQTVNQIQNTENRSFFLDILEIISIANDNKSQFDSIRDNIEILWKKLKEFSSLLDIYNDLEPTIRDEQEETVPVETGGSTTIINNAEDNFFFAYDLAGDILVGLTETALTLDTEIEDGTAFEHTSGNAEVEIKSGLKFDIEVDAGFYCNEGDLIELKLQRDEGSGYVDVPGSLAYISG